MQTWNIDKVCQVRVNSGNSGFIQTWQVRSYGGKEGRRKPPLPFLKIKKEFFINFSFEKYLGEKTPTFLPAWPFLCVFLTKFLSTVLFPRNVPWLEKFLVVRLHGEIILNPMPQTKGKCYSLVLSRYYFWMVWRCLGIPLVHCYYFCLEPTVERHLDENDFRHCYDNSFESGILKVTWSQLCSKVLLNNYKTHWKHHFEKIPYSWIIYGHGSTTYVLNLSSRLR